MDDKGRIICPRCWKAKPYYDFHLSGGMICASCFCETNPELVKQNQEGSKNES